MSLWLLLYPMFLYTLLLVNIHNEELVCSGRETTRIKGKCIGFREEWCASRDLVVYKEVFE